jgi:hypothetical protein
VLPLVLLSLYAAMVLVAAAIATRARWSIGRLGPVASALVAGLGWPFLLPWLIATPTPTPRPEARLPSEPALRRAAEGLLAAARASEIDAAERTRIEAFVGRVGRDAETLLALETARRGAPPGAAERLRGLAETRRSRLEADRELLDALHAQLVVLRFVDRREDAPERAAAEALLARIDADVEVAEWIGPGARIG